MFVNRSGTAKLDRTYTASNLLPATNYHLQAYAENSYGEGEKSNLLTVTTLNQPACGNSHDVAMQKAHFYEMKKDITNCLIKCIVSGKKCAQACISSKEGFSADCAMCWVEHGQCCAEKCAGECLPPNQASKGCIQCSINKCFPATAKCTGLPTWSFPLVSKR